MRVSSSGTRSTTRTMRTRSREMFDSTLAQNVSGSAHQSSACPSSSASSRSSWVDPGQLAQPPAPPARQLQATRSSSRRSMSTVGPVVAGRLHLDEERDRLAVDVHALPGRDIGVGRAGRRRSGRPAAGAAVASGRAQDEVGTRAEQLRAAARRRGDRSCWSTFARPSTMTTTPSSMLDPPPGQQAATATGARVADSRAQYGPVGSPTTQPRWRGAGPGTAPGSPGRSPSMTGRWRRSPGPGR